MATEILPVIQSHKINLTAPLCACNELVNSTNHCSSCGRLTFEPLMLFENENIKRKISYTISQKHKLCEERKALDEKILDTKNTIKEKNKQLISVTNGVSSLQHDIKVLKVKTVEESSQIIDIQQSQQAVKKELEELSERLFQEVENMVSTEKSQQQAIKHKNNHLRFELKLTQSHLRETEKEIIALKSKLNGPLPDLQEQQLQQRIMDTYVRAQLDTILMHGLNLGQLYMDTLENDNSLMDFMDFIQASHKTPLKNLHHLKYMKYCLRDDVKPCLRFGPNPKLSSKKIMEAILVKSCLVEDCPKDICVTTPETATAVPLWERFASPFLGCQACGRKINDAHARQEILNYRFRISYFDEWAFIDRFCRDRLVSVVEFYNFIRQLRAGVYKHRSLHELYQQLLRLKLQMFLAR